MQFFNMMELQLNLDVCYKNNWGKPQKKGKKGKKRIKEFGRCGCGFEPAHFAKKLIN